MILLIPTTGDPYGLLKEGPCGSRPPEASRQRGTDRWLPGWAWVMPEEAIAYEHALVLAHNGQPVPEGCERAKAVLASMTMATEWVHRDRTPFLGDVSGGGGYTFGRYDAETWFLRDVSGAGARFTVPHTDRGPLDYPLALATVCAARGLGEIVTDSPQ